MHVFVKTMVLAVFACLISQLSGCASSSSLVDVWNDDSFKSPPLSKVFVVAVRKDPVKRRIWEDAFAAKLSKHGVVATVSYSQFPDSLPDTNQITNTVQINRYDGILVVRRLPTITTKQNVPGYTSIEMNPGYVSYWERYWTYYREVNHPSYIDSQKVAINAIDVSTTGNSGRLIWSATSQTPDPASVTDVQIGVVDLVISQLQKQSIINSKK